MRVMTLLCLLLMLSACTAPGQATEAPRAIPETQTTPLVQPTAAPEQVTVAPRTPSEAPSEPVAPPTATPAFESGVPLFFPNWDRNRSGIHLVDPLTGQDVPGYPPIIPGENLSFASWPALSVDGQKLAMVVGKGQSCQPYQGGTSCWRRADVLHLIDAQAWREVTATLPAKGWVDRLSFSPDTTWLALVYNEPKSTTLMLFDTGTGEAVAQRPLGFRPLLIGYGQDGTTLVIYGQPLGTTPGMTQPEPPRVLLADSATLDVRWEQTLTSSGDTNGHPLLSGARCLENCGAPHGEQLFAHWRPAVVLSHDGRKLYIVHADAERLTTVDLDARAVRSVEIKAAQSWIERLLAFTAGVAEAKGGANGAVKQAVLSPDGTQLYVVGQTMTATRDADGHWQASETSLGLQVVDVKTGRKTANYDSEASRIKLTPDGAYLLLDGRDEHEWWTEVVDAASLRPVARLEKWEVVATLRMDGQPIILASQPLHQSQLAVLDPRTFEVVHSWSGGADAWWVTTP